jgi:hypothetical protein
VEEHRAKRHFLSIKNQADAFEWILEAEDAEATYDKSVSLSFLNSQGTVADRQAVAKLQAIDEKLKADLARAEFNRVKMKMKVLSDTATMTAVISRNVELQWRS